MNLTASILHPVRYAIGNGGAEFVIRLAWWYTDIDADARTFVEGVWNCWLGGVEWDYVGEYNPDNANWFLEYSEALGKWLFWNVYDAEVTRDGDNFLLTITGTYWEHTEGYGDFTPVDVPGDTPLEILLRPPHETFVYEDTVYAADLEFS